MYITAQAPRLRNDLYCVEWELNSIIPHLMVTVRKVDSGALVINQLTNSWLLSFKPASQRSRGKSFWGCWSENVPF